MFYLVPTKKDLTHHRIYLLRQRRGNGIRRKFRET
jgi:hypothetical protein